MPILVAANYYRSRHYFHENQTPLRVVKHYELELVETGNGFSFLGDQRFPHQPHLPPELLEKVADNGRCVVVFWQKNERIKEKSG